MRTQKSKIKWASLTASLLALNLASCAPASTSAPTSTSHELELQTLTEQNLIDILIGSCIQSTRNCDPSESIKEVKAALAEGIIELFSDYMQKDVTALVRSEAAGATATALLLSADMGIPTLDGGITGRAVPEVQQSIPWINGIASVPTAIITPWGDQIIVKHAIDEYRVEDISRAIAVASGGDATITMTPMDGTDLRRGVLKGNLSEAETYGRTVHEARDAGKDPIAALVEVSNGYKLFEGVVTKSEQRGDRGFNWVEAEFKGVNEYDNRTYKVYVKNENIVGWIDGELDAISPDYIYNLDPDTGESTLGVGYGGYVVGEKVALIGVPAPAQWRSKKGIELIGPRHFGFDFDFIPIETLQSK